LKRHQGKSSLGEKAQLIGDQFREATGNTTTENEPESPLRVTRISPKPKSCHLLLIPSTLTTRSTMAGLRMGWGSVLLALGLLLVVLPGKAAAFGAGNIPSIAQVEGHNWRHGGARSLGDVGKSDS
jgi:hypothetical protein